MELSINSPRVKSNNICEGQESGDECSLVKLEGTGHFELIDPDRTPGLVSSLQ